MEHWWQCMERYLRTKDFSVSQEEFQLLYDKKRELLITDPKPVALDSYYNSDAYISHTDARNTLLDRVYQYVKTISLNKKIALVNKYAEGNKTLLDIGSGTGDFLAKARNHGWQIGGVEPNDRARQKSLDKDISVKRSTEEFNNEKFQVITLWHVLEHLPELEKSIAKMAKLLEKDGTLIVAVPNFKSWDAQYYEEFWAAYDVPRHLWHFSRSAIANIFSEYGFGIKQVKPMWFDSFYVSILSEKYKKSSFPIFKGTVIGLWSNIRALFTKECSSHIYILKKDSN